MRTEWYQKMKKSTWTSEVNTLKVNKRSTPPLNEFDENDYDGEWLLIGRFLRTMTTNTSWTRKEASQLWKKAYGYFLRNGKI